MKIGFYKNCILQFIFSFFIFSSILFAQDAKIEFFDLKVGQTDKRHLGTDEIHAYHISLKKGEFLSVFAQPYNFDLQLVVISETSEEVIKSVNYFAEAEPETLWFESPADDDYLVTAVSGSGNFSTGDYELSVALDRTVTPLDRKRLEGERLFISAYDYESENSSASRQKAIENFIHASALWKETGDKFWEATALNNIGRNYVAAGQAQKALESYQKAITLFQSVAVVSGEGYATEGIGAAFEIIGEKRKSLEYFQKALKLFEKVGAKKGEAAVLRSLATLLDQLDERENAKVYYEKSLAAERALGDRRGEARALTALGTIYSENGDEQKALDVYKQSLPVFEETEDLAGEMMTLINIGEAYAKLDKNGAAFGNLMHGLYLAKGLGDKRSEAQALKTIAIVWALMGNRRLSVLFGKLAINAFQEMRRDIKALDVQSQRVFLQKIENNYRILAYELIESNRLAESFQVLNLFKDQEFFDYLQTETINEKSAISLLELTKSETEYAKKLDEVDHTLWNIADERARLRRIVKTEKDVADKYLRLQELYPEEQDAVLKQIEIIQKIEKEGLTDNYPDKLATTAELSEFQNTLKELSVQTGQKTVALSALAGKHFRLLLITPEDIKVFKSDAKEDELNRQVLEFLNVLRSPDYDPRPQGKNIYDAIFKPAEKELEKIKPDVLLWFLDNNLRYIPPAALYDGKNYLAERFETVILTRSNRQRLLAPVSNVWKNGLGFGVTEAQTVRLNASQKSYGFSALEGVREEMTELFGSENDGGILKGSWRLDKNFTKDGFFKMLDGKNAVVHIASHFQFTSGDENDSFLLLGGGDILTLGEIGKRRDLFKNVELLTLSACSTAAQQANADGREIDGFAELAQRQGAGAVLATLWAVADNSTPILMKEFYKSKQTGKINKAEAVRQAQLKLLYGKYAPDEAAHKRGTDVLDLSGDNKSQILFKKDENAPFAHPYYWSPFVLIGNWR